MNSYLKNWNLLRLLRLALGVFVIMQGINDNDWVVILLGGLFSLMPLLNFGCCGVSGCNTYSEKRDKKTEEVIFEEVK